MDIYLTIFFGILIGAIVVRAAVISIREVFPYEPGHHRSIRKDDIDFFMNRVALWAIALWCTGFGFALGLIYLMR